ncbi:alpha/beta hydrolase [Nocardia sp. CDC160]|uniref:alpha/beta hydrolase n=1 Tax=Nocardia sp. CDC160 TaxID=3112166 RepID=UPI002DB59199|nr:alpha/beta hydrolase family protein [Nocardia sp. CDC160]MEC3914034.1 alpha/beta hydrolase family protein [Nocardia sp. CDC160]
MRVRGFTRKVLGVAAAALLMPVGVAVIEAPPAAAAFDPAIFDFWVDSPVMGPIKTRILRARDGNTQRVAYVLDGMRAQEDLSGWEINTNVPQVLADWNINVVMPIGGPSSFYADWDAPSSFFGLTPGTGSSAYGTGSGATEALGAGPGKSYRYAWEDFITNHLRWELANRLGFNPNRNGVFGLSMGGSAALTLAAYHPDFFSYAGSYSGYLNISAPGMREAIRLAMLDAGGYNVDCMALPWGPTWLRMDPFVFAPTLIANNTRVWVSAGSGAPMPDDLNIPIGMAADRLIRGAPLEALALANSRAFQVRMLTLGAQNVVWDFPADGLHAWTNWANDAYRMIPDMSANIG